MSHKIVVSPAVGNTPASAVVTEAKVMDIVTTVFSADSAVTGTYGLLQKGALFLGGMSVQSKRKLGTFNPL